MISLSFTYSQEIEKKDSQAHFHIYLIAASLIILDTLLISFFIFLLCQILVAFCTVYSIRCLFHRNVKYNLSFQFLYKMSYSRMSSFPKGNKLSQQLN